MTSDNVADLHGVPVYRCDAAGPVLRTSQDAVDLLGTASWLGADLVVLPVERLPAEFFRLRSGVAGEIVQKFVNYRMRLAIVGDLTEELAASTALRGFVTEANRGRQLWFVATEAELAERLTGGRAA